ncbi:MAG: hypothetical protein HY718_15990 [Planctomycetes bacterium]|nr:hypothetical protein [Planctomycetota bacterium]
MYDRWHYPFSFTPGTRSVATCFGAAGSAAFNDRDGCVVVVWNTGALLPAGLGVEAYGVRSVRVTLTNPKDATWQIDTTVDEWFTYDVNGDDQLNADGVARGEPGDLDGESDDADAGRPIELFGAGFGPTYTLQTWTETSLYVGSDSVSDLPRDPFPFVFLGGGPDALHVEDNVKGLHNAGLGVYQFTPQPWAIGNPQQYTPGSQPTPFDVTFDVDLGLSGGSVRWYFREQLNAGRVAVYVTSLREALMFGSGPQLPAFFMKEGLSLDPGAKAARLDIDACQPVGPDFDFDCDVDEDDLDAFEVCQTGPGLGPPATGCERADFDNDLDVDSTDFAAWQRCSSGPGNDPQPHCDE